MDRRKLDCLVHLVFGGFFLFGGKLFHRSFVLRRAVQFCQKYYNQMPQSYFFTAGVKSTFYIFHLCVGFLPALW